MKVSSVKFFAATAALVALAAPSFGQLCGLDWAPTKMQLGALNGSVACSQVWDDGTGPKLFLGGTFTSVNGVTGGANICKWDGTAFSDVGGGMIGGQVLSMCVHDDGTGPALFVGGWFTGPGTPGVAKWNGVSWQPLGSGVGSSGVSSVCSFDDGTGPALYAGGWFLNDLSNSAPLNYIAKWQGGAWSQVGGGLSSGVTAMIVYNNALYVSGAFGTAGSPPLSTPHLARWTSAGWSAIGITGSGDINAFSVFDPGTGPRLYAGGTFSNVGGVTINRLAQYDGVTWSAVGTGPLAPGIIFCMTTYNDGASNALYIGGSFTSISGTAANRIVKCDGTNFSALGNGITVGVPRCLASFPSPFGAQLFVGGTPSTVGNGVTSYNLATWGPTPPYIITEPVGAVVNHGAPASFSVTAGGQGLAYQWRHNFTPVPGATTPTYNIPAVNPLHWGVVDCQISNGCGITTSAPAPLTLNPGINLTVQQPFGSLSFYVQHSAPGQGGLGYFTHFSFDVLNSTNPGQGPFWGCWTTLNDIITQYLNGFPPFQGLLDGGGNAVFVLGPNAVPVFLLGQTVTAVSCTYTPALQLVANSNLQTVTIF
jgi:hypothetical protein